MKTQVLPMMMVDLMTLHYSVQVSRLFRQKTIALVPLQTASVNTVASLSIQAKEILASIQENLNKGSNCELLSPVTRMPALALVAANTVSNCGVCESKNGSMNTNCWKCACPLEI